MSITAPSNPNATAISTSQINLTWGASTTGGGAGASDVLPGDVVSGDLIATLGSAAPVVTGYRVFRNGVQIASVDAATLSFADLGRTPATTYSYFIIGVDSLNEQAPSAAVQATTFALPAALPLQGIFTIFETRAATFTVRSGPDMLTFAVSQLAPSPAKPFPGQRVEFRADGSMVLHNPSVIAFGLPGITAGLSVLPGEMETPWGDLAARGNHPA